MELSPDEQKTIYNLVLQPSMQCNIRGEGKWSKGGHVEKVCEDKYLVNLVFYCRTKVNRIREIIVENLWSISFLGVPEVPVGAFGKDSYVLLKNKKDKKEKSLNYSLLRSYKFYK